MKLAVDGMQHQTCVSFMAYIKSVIPNTTDPYQFAYRSVDDAVCLALNYVYKHLDKRNTYAFH